MSSGVKFDGEKPDWSLLPLEALSGVVRVLTAGALKYQPNNWKTVKHGRRRYFAAALRHLVEYQRGIDPEDGIPSIRAIDEEFGCSHLDHALCCLIFVRYLDSDVVDFPRYTEALRRLQMVSDLADNDLNLKKTLLRLPIAEIEKQHKNLTK